MNRLRLASFALLFVIAQILAAMAPPSPQVLAQDAELVLLVEGSGSIEDCATWSESALDEDFQNIVESTPETACEGGVVWVIPTTRAEADAALRGDARSARTKAKGSGDGHARHRRGKAKGARDGHARHRRGKAKADGRSQVGSDLMTVSRVVPISGDAAQDEASVRRAVDEIHQAILAQDGGDSDQVALGAVGGSRDGPEIAGLVTPQGHFDNCRRSGAYERQYIRYRAYRANTDVTTVVDYRRVTCQLWRFTGFNTKADAPPARDLRTYVARYELVWWGGNDFRASEYFTECKLITNSGWTYDRPPDWYITTKGYFQFGVLSASELYPDSCFYNGGQEVVSLWTRLPGPNR